MKKQLSVLLKPVSSTCNMDCTYCFYNDIAHNRITQNYGNMSQQTRQTIIQRIAEALEEEGIANIAFQGGEPMLAGIAFYEAFHQEISAYPNIEVHYSIQTNGTLIDEAWLSFFKEKNFLVGISLDGDCLDMDQYRKTIAGKSVYNIVQKAIQGLKEYEIPFNILSVVTNQLAEHPHQLFSYYLENELDYIQLIPCLPPLYASRTYAVSPNNYQYFYKELFDDWLKTYKNGQIIHINLFENLFGMLQGYPPNQCGLNGRCTIQFVIEANGNVYPCDFYCLDENCLGNIHDTSLLKLYQSALAQTFLKEGMNAKAFCKSCTYKNFCHGGCRRMQVCYLEDANCAHKEVLDYILPILQSLL